MRWGWVRLALGNPGELAAGADACTDLITIDKTKMDTLLQALLLQMHSLQQHNAEQDKRIRALSSGINVVPVVCWHRHAPLTRAQEPQNDSAQRDRLEKLEQQ